ncbi:MAG: hypothetical protein CMI36_04385 [Owenweeksia sp.]|nr:hypothetical protein [Owenweeksia sp.]MBF98208.1 hypothetical protein [Owenweeksia sp.]HCQ15804.1 hypothetical protein [Cryomorphaceae bacterium]|tara:strand:- start:917 stop:1324 length:408 start_codon:yes stop_codon:yes gene_type:complete
MKKDSFNEKIIYIIPGILIAVFIVYFTVSVKDTPKQQTGKTDNHQTMTEFNSEWLTADTWWNDPEQVALDFYEDNTGFLVRGTERIEITYQVNNGVLTATKAESDEVLISGNIVSVTEESLTLKTSGKEIIFTHY